MASRAGYLKKKKIGVCVMCRQVFQCARFDKRTCSDKCRKRLQRWHKNEAKEIEKKKAELAQIKRLTALIHKTENNPPPIQIDIDRW